MAKTCPYGLSPSFAASKLTYEPLPQDDPKQRPARYRARQTRIELEPEDCLASKVVAGEILKAAIERATDGLGAVIGTAVIIDAGTEILAWPRVFASASAWAMGLSALGHEQILRVKLGAK